MGRVSAFAGHIVDVELTNAQQPIKTKKQIKKACKARQDAVFRGFCIFELSPYLRNVFHEN